MTVFLALTLKWERISLQDFGTLFYVKIEIFFVNRHV